MERRQSIPMYVDRNVTLRSDAEEEKICCCCTVAKDFGRLSESKLHSLNPFKFYLIKARLSDQSITQLPANLIKNIWELSNEIKLCHWLLQVVLQILTNQSTLFESRAISLLWNKTLWLVSCRSCDELQPIRVVMRVAHVLHSFFKWAIPGLFFFIFIFSIHNWQ